MAANMRPDGVLIGHEPKTPRGWRTRERILEVAREVLTEKGLADTSVSEICERVPMALGSFYNYFDSKDHIFDALLRDYRDRFRAAIRTSAAKADPKPANDGQASVETRISDEIRALRAVLDFAAENRGFFRVLLDAEMHRPEEHREFLDGFVKSYVRNFQRQFDSRVRSREHVVTLSLVVFGVAEQFSTRWLNDGRVGPPDVAYDAFESILRRGLAGILLDEEDG